MKPSLLVFALLLFILSACNVSGTLQPSVTPSPIPTLKEPTTTPIPTPTSTATLAATLTPETESNQLARLAVLDDFIVSVPFPLLYQVNRDIILIGDEEKTLTMSFSGDGYDGVKPLADVIDSYLAGLEKRGWQLTRGDSEDVQIDGSSGLTVNLTALYNNITFAGQAVAVSPRKDFVLFGLGLSKTDTDPNSWKDKNQDIFADMLATIKFTNTNAECPVATDKAYGYKEENPIKIGGGDFTGPSRERAYLDHLRGPNNGQLSYERQGSKDSGNTILDIYQIKGPGVNAILYIDEYNYSEPQAPVGFTCTGAFPLSAP